MAQYRTRTWKLIFGRPVNVSAGKTTNIYDSMSGPKAGSSGLYEVGSDSGPANIEFSLINAISCNCVTKLTTC